MKITLPAISIILLSACQSDADRLVFDQWRPLSVDNQRICYSLNKDDVLNYYDLTSSEGGAIHSLLNSGYEPLSLSYPHSCIDIKLKTGFVYVTLYILNGVKYRYDFFIDNSWNVVGLERGKY